MVVATAQKKRQRPIPVLAGAGSWKRKNTTENQTESVITMNEQVLAATAGQSMREQQKEAVAAIGLMAAVADGRESGLEYAKLREISQRLDIQASAAVTQRVLALKTSLDDEVAALSTPEVRMLAFELAVCICDADGVTTSREQKFLDRFREAISIASVAISQTPSQAENFAKAACADASGSIAASASQTTRTEGTHPVDAGLSRIWRALR